MDFFNIPYVDQDTKGFIMMPYIYNGLLASGKYSLSLGQDFPVQTYSVNICNFLCYVGFFTSKKVLNTFLQLLDLQRGSQVQTCNFYLEINMTV